MELTTRLYLGLLSAVALGRVLELRLSRRNQARLTAAGSTQTPEAGYVWMVLFHSALICATAVEVAQLHRPVLAWLALPSLVVFALANGLRWWVIFTLGSRWNTQVMSPSLGIVDRGPYRWVRHPNYTAVFIEMLALPLIHTAWITATVGALLHALILSRRVAVEESTMMQDASYRAAFAGKPRFLPWGHG